MRSPHIILVLAVAVLALFLVTMYTFSASQYRSEDTNWQIRYLQDWANTFSFRKSEAGKDTKSNASDDFHANSASLVQRPHSFWNHELDPAFSGVVNSVFPVDLIISYNISNKANSSQITTEFVARYASFSPILKDRVHGQYAFVAGSACSEIDPHKHPQYKDKILIVPRGQCSFVQKFENIVRAKLRPRAVVVANNVPHGGLITMYSKTFNGDESLRFPVLFMSYEDSETLRRLHTHIPQLELSIRTASFDGVFGLVLLMAVSPPLMILICYLIIRGMQLYTRHRRNQINQQYVKLLPVHIYNRSHLVPSLQFYEYLVATNQTNEIPLVASSTEDLSTAHLENTLSAAATPILPPENGPYLIGGTDLYSMAVPLLFAQRDFYPTQKCSICLDRFVPLKSRVLVLGCKHIYHEKCLSNWLINFRKTCPLCNEALQTPFTAEHTAETLPLSQRSLSDYGTFGSDLESSGHVMERHFSTTAVRSLQVELVVSQPVSVPQTMPGSHREVDSQSLQNTQGLKSRSAQNLQDPQNPENLLNPRFEADSYNSAYALQTSTPELRAASEFNPLEPSNSPSDASFVTTKSHQLAAVSHAYSLTSYASSYHTLAGVLAGEDDGDTLLYESSRSTLRCVE